MKKIIIYILLGFGIFAVGGCGQSSNTSPSPSPSPDPEPSVTIEQQTFDSSKAQSLEVTVTIQGTTQTVTQEVVNDLIVVSLATGESESNLSSQLSNLGYSIVGKNSDTKCYQISLPSGKTLSQAITDMYSVSSVKNAGTDPITRKEIINPNEGIYSKNDTEEAWPFLSLDMKKVWDLTTGESGVIVSIVDSGIKLTHPEFENRFVYKNNYVANNTDPDDNEIDSHGTGVGGIACAKGNNSRFIAGMNWNCNIMPIKVLDNNGEGSTYAAANAVDYAAAAGAADGKKTIVNYSGGGWYNSWTNSSIIEKWQSVSEKCANYGALLVFSAGNDNSDVVGNFSTHYPGGGLTGDNIITVAGLDRQGNLTSGTNYGSQVTVAAPGERIRCPEKDYSYGELVYHDGTSFAAPFVTGLASLIWSINPNLTASQVKTCIVSGADPISGSKNVGKKINPMNSILLALQYKGSGVIAIKSNPSGSNISISGTDKGRITTSEGYTYFEATEGDHIITAAKTGYTSSSETITVIKGAIKYCDLTLGGAEPTRVYYEFGPYNYYATPTTESLSIPAGARVYIGNATSEGERIGFFDCGYAGYLKINNTMAAYNMYYSDSVSGSDWTKYYGSGTTNYIYITTEATSSWAKYNSDTSITGDRLWIEITNLINLGAINSFNFYHYTSSKKGFLIRIDT